MKFESFDNPEVPEESLIVDQVFSRAEEHKRKKEAESEALKEDRERREAYDFYQELLAVADTFKQELLESYDVETTEMTKLRKGRVYVNQPVPKAPERVLLDLEDEVKNSRNQSDIRKMRLVKNIYSLYRKISNYVESVDLHIIATQQNTKKQMEPIPEGVTATRAEIDRRNYHQALISTTDQIRTDFDELAREDSDFEALDKMVKSVLKSTRYDIQVWAENVRNEAVSRALMERQDSVPEEEQSDVRKSKGEAA